MCTDAPQTPLEWRIGLVGFAYPEWTSSFYPAQCPDRARFSFYTGCFDTVEINTTFYGPPSVATVSGWARKSPPSFRFALKAPRDVTHGPTPPGSLANADGPPAGHFARPETLAVLLRLFEAASHLRDQLGPILLQFPPAFEDRARSELSSYLDQVAPRVSQLQSVAPHARLALEFRHDSWGTPATAAMLAERAMVMAVGDHTPRAQMESETVGRIRPPLPLTVTADAIYLRLLGKHGQFRQRTHEQADPTRCLRAWTERVGALYAANRALRTVYVYVDNDYAGHAPATAARLQKLIGQTAPVPRHQPAAQNHQPSLFDNPGE